MQSERGFTIVELAATVSILAILAAIAVPPFQRLIQSSQVSTNVNTFLADVRFARSEAIRRGGNVVICRSDRPEAEDAQCEVGDGVFGRGWASGWLVFHDLDRDGNRGPHEPVLRAQAGNPSIGVIEDGRDSSARRSFRFAANGRLVEIEPTVALRFGASTKYAERIRKTVCLGPSGRPRVAGDASAACEA